MPQACEVCATLGRSPSTKRVRRVLVGDRLVHLCDSHARVLSGFTPASVAELRQVFRENGGKRSLVERRQELDRRVFPARPEGRRRNSGRRASDTR
jgi:hypothetical protein